MKINVKRFIMQVALLVKVLLGMSYYAKIQGLSYMTWAQVIRMTKFGIYISLIFWIYILFAPTQTE